MSFVELELSESLLRAVREEGYELATPIQREAIPIILSGRDLSGCAQTGTGKTAAFALPTLERLGGGTSRHQERGRKVRCLVLAPTRELAAQIGESFRAYGRFTGLRHAVIYGGVGQVPQVKAIRNGADVLIATPGRLLDLMNQGHVSLDRVEILILDEADQMLDMGFIHDLRRIVARVPRERQTLLFSATMPGEIRSLADQWLSDPAEVRVAPQATPAERVSQSVFFIPKKAKPEFLARYIRDQNAQRTLVFARTKHGADKLVKSLVAAGVRAEAIHGNKSQTVRQRVLAQFKSQHPPVLVATDIAARGLDIDNISHVVNFDLPLTPEIYVHRIGRTARAGAEGIAITFCDHEERGMLREIERLTRQQIPVAPGSPEPTDRDAMAAGGFKPNRFDQRSRRPQGGNRRYGQNRSQGNANGAGNGSASGQARPHAAGGRPAFGRPGKQKSRRFSRV